MKKNKMMRLASLLLVLTLLTTSVISGTFAKYVTDIPEVSDTARVAKWGVTGEITGTAFATSYEAHDEDTELDITVLTDPNGDGKNLVAPGTNGTFGGIDLEGTPEVAVRITTTANLTLTGWEVNGAFYCPIVFTVNGTEIKQDTTNDTAAKLEAAVEAAIMSANGEYEPNTDLSAVTGLNGDYGWAWAFVGDNTKDTALGDAAADGNAATITLAVSTIVEQVD